MSDDEHVKIPFNLAEDVPADTDTDVKKKKKKTKKKETNHQDSSVALSESGITTEILPSPGDDVSEQEKMIIKKLNDFAALPESIENDTRLVLMQFQLYHLEEIDTSEQTARIDFGISFWWKEPLTVGLLGDSWKPEEKLTFWPDLEFSGEIKLIPFLPNHGSVWMHSAFSPHGIMNNFQRWKGRIHIPLDLEEFPFDQQVIHLRISSWAWGKYSMVLQDISPPAARHNITEHLQHLVEFEPVEHVSIREWDRYDFCEERYTSTVSVYFPLKRKSGFYLKNIISMGFIICLMGLSVCFDSQADLPGRLTITITLFLATVAFNFVTAEFLPKVSYMNYMSEFFLVMYGFLALEVVESVAAYSIVKFVGAGDPAAAPQAQKLDWAAIGIISSGQLLYLIRFIYIAYFRSPKPLVFDDHHKKHHDNEEHADDHHEPMESRGCCCFKSKRPFKERHWKTE